MIVTGEKKNPTLSFLRYISSGPIPWDLIRRDNSVPKNYSMGFSYSLVCTTWSKDSIYPKDQVWELVAVFSGQVFSNQFMDVIPYI